MRERTWHKSFGPSVSCVLNRKLSNLVRLTAVAFCANLCGPLVALFLHSPTVVGRADLRPNAEVPRGSSDPPKEESLSGDQKEGISLVNGVTGAFLSVPTEAWVVLHT